MTIGEKAEVLMKEIDKRFMIPYYMEKFVEEGIIKGLRIIEEQEGKEKE